MIESGAEFGKALSNAIYAIKFRESKSIAIIQDELGYAIGRKGGSSIEYWRKGNIPASHIEIEHLATEILKRSDLDHEWLCSFLTLAEHPAPHPTANKLSAIKTTPKPLNDNAPKQVAVTAPVAPVLAIASSPTPQASNQRLPAFLGLFALIVLALLAYQILPKQNGLPEFTFTEILRPTAAAEPTVVTAVLASHDVLNLTQDGWPDWCAMAQNDGTVIAARAENGDTSCVNRAFSADLNDFTAETVFELTDGAGMFIVGQDTQYYWIAISKAFGYVQLAAITESGTQWLDVGEGFYHPTDKLHTQNEALNTVRVTRRGDQIAFYLNGNLIDTTEDFLFKGERARVFLGVGAKSEDSAETAVTFHSMELHENE